MSVYPGPILVLGSGRNVGLGLAKRLVAQGAQVILTYRSAPEPVIELQNDYPNQVLGAVPFISDAETSIRSAMDAVADITKDLYAVINTVGPFIQRPLDKTDPQTFTDLVQGNLIQAYTSAWLAKPLLQVGSGGRIIWFTFAGVDKLGAYSKISAYAAVKTGLLSLSRSLAAQWARDRITVNTIAPGLVSETDEENFPPSALESGEGRVAIGDLWQAVKFLLSPDARKITGVNITVSGGYGL